MPSARAKVPINSRGCFLSISSSTVSGSLDRSPRVRAVQFPALRRHLSEASEASLRTELTSGRLAPALPNGAARMLRSSIFSTGPMAGRWRASVRSSTSQPSCFSGRIRPDRCQPRLLIARPGTTAPDEPQPGGGANAKEYAALKKGPVPAPKRRAARRRRRRSFRCSRR